MKMREEFLLKIYGAALHLYPAEFQAKYREPMLDAARRSQATSRNDLQLLKHLLHDTMWSALQEHWRATSFAKSGHASLSAMLVESPKTAVRFTQYGAYLAAIQAALTLGVFLFAEHLDWWAVGLVTRYDTLCQVSLLAVHLHWPIAQIDHFFLLDALLLTAISWRLFRHSAGWAICAIVYQSFSICAWVAAGRGGVPAMSIFLLLSYFIALCGARYLHSHKAAPDPEIST
jgi:hypothetical protein